MNSRSLVASIIAATATVGLLLLAAPQIASAAVPAPPTASIVHTDASTVFGATSSSTVHPNSTSPSGCIMRADYPHKSGHVPGTADGVVTTTCNQYVPEITFTAQMWETRWWGWDRIGKKGVAARFDVETLSATASDVCKKNTVRVTASGHVIDEDLRSYYASVESIHVNNPCGLR